MNEMPDLTTGQYDALIDVAGKASHLVQEWAEVTDAGRSHLVGAVGHALRRLDAAACCDGTTVCEDHDFAAERGVWVRRIGNVPPHECMPPARGRSSPLFDGAPIADAKRGELWRCNCGRLWECYRRRLAPGEVGGQRMERWRPAGVWLQARYARIDWVQVGLWAAAVVVLVSVVLAQTWLTG